MTDNAWIAVGDVDGDGMNDAALVSHDCDWAVYVHAGPFALDGSTTWISDSAYAWRGPVPNQGDWMWQTAAGGDLDGDGLDDLVGTSGGTLDDAGVCSFDVFLGGAWDAPVARVSDVAPNGLTYSARYLHVLEDTDGDGMAEVEASLGSGVHAFIRGADASTGDGALATDLAYAILQGHPDDAVDDIWGESNIASVGDWNGDGTADIVAVARASATLGYEHGEVFLLDGSLRGELSLDDALGSWVGTDGNVRFFGQLDADGDGEPELIVNDYGYGTHILRHVLPAMRTPLDGIVLTDSATTRGSTGDFNADGYDDWVVGDLTEKTQNLWFGFDIPWDDARYW